MDSLAEFNHNLLSCNISGLPTETLVHKGTDRSSHKYATTCILKNSKRRTIANCRNKLEQECFGNIATVIENNCSSHIKNARKIVEKYGSDLISLKLTKNIPPAFMDYAKCSSEYRGKFAEPCLPAFKEKCDKSKFVTYKGLRLTMYSVGAMLERDPDMFVVYFIRDPRSIVTSRFDTRLTYRNSFQNRIKEAGFLCEKMLHDFNMYTELDAKYPGAIKLVKYEDLTRNRYTVVKDIYKHFNMEVHQSVYDWIKENEQTGSSSGRFGINRTNSTASIDKWKRKNSIANQRGMTEVCKNVLELLGYEL